MHWFTQFFLVQFTQLFLLWIEWRSLWFSCSVSYQHFRIQRSLDSLSLNNHNSANVDFKLNDVSLAWSSSLLELPTGRHDAWHVGHLFFQERKGSHKNCFVLSIKCRLNYLVSLKWMFYVLNREFKQGHLQRQRRHQKTMIWLAEPGKIIAMDLSTILWRSLPNENVKFPNWRI